MLSFAGHVTHDVSFCLVLLLAQKGSMSSIPVKILFEAVGQKVTVELDTGDQYHGLLVNVEDNMNIELQDVDHVNKQGKKREVANVYLRGSNVVFFTLPDALQTAPCIQAAAAVVPAAADGRGRGRGAAPSRGRGRGGRGEGGRGRGDGGRGRAGGFGARKRPREE